MILRHTKHRAFTRGRGSRSGNSIIEMAIVMPVLLYLSMGMAEFGQFFYIRSAFVSAARDGCRKATLPSSTQATVVSTITSTLQQANVTYNASWVKFYDINTSGQQIQVTDITTIPSGDGVVVAFNVIYDQIPNAYRPLYSITGKGIQNGKLISPQTMMCKN